MRVNKNKQHWDELGVEYSKAWASKSKEFMNLKEMGFINKFLSLNEPKKALDIGIGNGRILANYLKNTRNCAIYGVDISDEMVSVCEKRFGSNPAIANLAVCNFSKENPPFNITFDFISSIRVIKYNKNWPEMIRKMAHLLNKDGVAVFDMPNKYSLNVLGYYKIPFYRSSKKEMEKICKQNNLKLLDMQSFTRIPDVFYMLSNNETYANCVVLMEKFLSKVFGKTFLGRILFVAVKRNA